MENFTLLYNKMNKFNRKKSALTLVEIMTVLVVLGIISSITVPQVAKRYEEATKRAKIKKAMAVYDIAINKMITENEIKSTQALKTWADSDTKNYCANTSHYFKVKSGSGCIFETSDGIRWNISDVTKPLIALKEDAFNKYTALSPDNTAFYLFSEYDENGIFRTDDINWEIEQGLYPKEAEKLKALLLNKKYEGSTCIGDYCLSGAEDGPYKCTEAWVMRLGNSWSGDYSACGERTNYTFYKKTGEANKQLSCTGDYCIVNDGYFCEIIGDEVQCHINAGQVPDIRYDSEGNVAEVLCNCYSWQNCSYCDRNPKSCQTANCNYNEEKQQWESSSDEQDVYLQKKAVCELYKKLNKTPTMCENIS